MPKKRLHLHRQTLRVLSGPDLASVAGGDEYLKPKYRYTTDEVKPDEKANPKSNGWSEFGQAACS